MFIKEIAFLNPKKKKKKNPNTKLGNTRVG